MLEGQIPSSIESTIVFQRQHTATEAHANDHDGRETPGHLVTRRAEELRPHPSFVRHNLCIPADELSLAASQADVGLPEPIVISQDNVILKGYAQWQLASLRRQETTSCIEYRLSEEEALHCLLQYHRRSHGLNDFARIVLALDLEPLLQEKARSNQRMGGHTKGSSTLTKAVRVDVRSQIAAAATVSTGNVTKVKQLLSLAHLDVLEAVRCSELSIHRAWQWCSLPPQQQTQRLFQQRSAKEIRKNIRELVSRHVADDAHPVLALAELLRGLQGVDGERLRTIQVAVVDTPGFGIIVSKELFHAIGSQKELPL